MAKRMTAQINPHPFNPFNPIWIISFLKYFKLVWDTNGVHKGVAVWQINFFMNKTASAVLYARLSADSIGKKYSQFASGKTRCFITYPQVVSFLLQKYATDVVIAKSESDINHFAQQSSMTLS